MTDDAKNADSKNLGEQFWDFVEQWIDEEGFSNHGMFPSGDGFGLANMRFLDPPFQVHLTMVGMMMGENLPEVIYGIDRRITAAAKDTGMPVDLPDVVTVVWLSRTQPPKFGKIAYRSREGDKLVLPMDWDDPAINQLLASELAYTIKNKDKILADMKQE